MKKLIIIILSVLFSINAFSQGEVSGTVQDWSLHRVVMNTNFDTAFKKTDSWITPEMFGAVGDGVTDDSTALQDCFAYATTNGKNIQFGNQKIYRTTGQHTVSNTIIYGNQSTIDADYSGAQGLGDKNYTILSYGSLGTPVNLLSDVSKSTNVIYTQSTSILNNIEVGSLIKITSDQAFTPNDAAKLQGEINKVWLIQDSAIYFSNNFYDTYLVDSGAKVAIITPNNIRIEDLTMIGNGVDHTIGIDITYADNPIIKGCKFYNCNYASVYTQDSYHPDYRYDSYNTIQSGAGYGAVFIGANMRPKVSLNVEGARHPITFDGSTNGGVSWDWLAYNTNAKGIRGGSAYNTHFASGKGEWLNCNVYLGLSVTDSVNYKGFYNSATTYNLGDIISYEGVLYESMTASNQGNTVDTAAVTQWDLYNNDIVGFFVGSDNVTITNGNVYGNATYGVQILPNISIERLKINGLDVHNSSIGLRLTSAATLDDSYIDKLNLYNKVYKKNKYAIQLINDTLRTTNFNDIGARGAAGVYISNHNGDEIDINSINAEGQLLTFGDQDVGAVIVNLNKAKIKMIPEISNAIDVIDGCEIESLHINEIYVDDLINTFIGISDTIQSLNIGSITFSTNQAGNLIIAVGVSGVLNNLYVNSVMGNEDYTVTYCTNAGVLNKAYLGGLKANLLGVGSPYAGTLPVLEILQGNFDYPWISRGAGSPNGVVAANQGSMYYNRSGGAGVTLYVKEGGVSTTSWVAK